MINSIPVTMLAPNLQSQVAQRLRQRILSGVLTPGTPLREQSLAKEFGISRGPIRDAFLTLSNEGLLMAKPNVGVRVADQPTVFKRGVIVQLRRTIETAALAEWFETRDEALLDRLDANLRAYESACREGDLNPVVELDMEFHRLIVESADDGGLLGLWKPVILQMFLRYSRHRSLLESHSEHVAICEAMRTCARTTALKRLREHIQ